MYPGVDFRNEFHVDHVFPKSRLTEAKLRAAGLQEDDVHAARANVNRVANLQLLEGPFNEAKRAKLPRGWAESRFGAYSPEFLHYISVNDLDGLPDDVTQFTGFVEARRQKIRDRLTTLLGVKGESTAFA